MKKLLYWTPRVLGILFAAFVSIFALDVFGAGYGPWETIVALLAHLIPTYLLVAALAIAWRWGWLGGLAFIGLGGLYVAVFGGPFHWSVYLVMAGTPCLIGLLFLADWFHRHPARGASDA